MRECSARVSLLILGVLLATKAGAWTLEADLDELDPGGPGIWNGSDLSGRFTDDWVTFSNKYHAWGGFSGFSYSRVADTNTPGFGNQYAVISGAGAGGTGTYAVAFDDTFDEQDVIAFPYPVCVKGFHINNTTYAALSMRDGDAFAKKFGGVTGDDPDWFKLTITGRDDAGVVTGSNDFYLADYRFTNNTLDYIVTDWTWVDLTLLGPGVRTLHFSLSSTDNGGFGMNTPAYFALDNVTFVPRPRVTKAGLAGLDPGTNVFWNGADLSGYFEDQCVVFSNKYHVWGGFSGFAYSRVNDTNTPGFGNQYAVISGTGHGGTGVYAIAFDDVFDQQDVIELPYAAKVKGVYFNNTTYAALSMRDGDAFAKKFGGVTGNDPDWFKVDIVGKDAAGNTVGSNDFYLADFRFTNNALDYIVHDWTWVDLTSLGAGVQTLHFSLSSTDNGGFGMNTPAYFALDDLCFVPSFSRALAGTNAWDAGVPGFVGPDGDGNSTGSSNVVNPAFAGWAFQVGDYSPAPGVDGAWMDSSKALGPVTGDNFDVVSLGDLDQGQIDTNAAPGRLTLCFATPISDEAGPDFAVFENALIEGGTGRLFGELAYVEVSSDATNFVRFPSVSFTTNAVGAFGTIDSTYVYNLAGKHSNAGGDSWGTPFDLADIACDPAVLNGTVQLTNIAYVRIVDIPGSGDYYDSFSPSNPVYDAWVTIGSSGVDIDAVGVLNSPLYERVLVKTGRHGLVTPYGAPDGLVSVARGSNVTFSIVPEAGFHIADVRLNGISLGRPATVTLSNVTADHCLEVTFGHRLVVYSDYGAGDPAIGTNYGFGDMSAAIHGHPIVNGGTQIVAAGWTGSGSVPVSGVGSNTGVFNLTNDSALTWTWDTNYWLAAAALSMGTVTPPGGWFENGSNVTLTASPRPFYNFGGWTGDTQGDTNLAQMTATMDRARAVSAGFWTELATNSTPVPWLEHHGLTNAPPDVEAMQDIDGDGLLAWEEYQAGTDPTDDASQFTIIDQSISNGCVSVTWVAGTNVWMTPFAIDISTNCGVSWACIAENLERSPTGTNVWGPICVDGKVFFRVVIPDEDP